MSGGIYDVLMQTLPAIDSGGRALAGTLAGDQEILMILAASSGIMLAWRIISAMLSTESLAAELLKAARTLVHIAVLVAVFSNYTTIVGAVAGVGSFIADKLSYGQHLVDTTLDTIAAALRNVDSTVIYNSQTSTLLDIVDAIKTVPDRIMSALLGLVASLAIMLVGAVAVGVVMFGKVGLWVGAAVGPVLLALTPLPFFQGLGTHWLRYMLGMSMIQAIATAELVLLQGIFGALTTMAQGLSSQASGYVMTVTAASAAFLSIITIVLMLQAPSMTRALVGGGGGDFNLPNMPDLPKPGGGGQGGTGGKK